jgi:hypothetical protein
VLGLAAGGSWLVGVPHFAAPFGTVGGDGWHEAAPLKPGAD